MACITRAANRQRWRDRIEAWRDSGLTQHDYCARHELTFSSFQRGRRIFRCEGVENATPHLCGQFVPARLVSESQSGSGLVLEVNEALRLEVAYGFDTTTLHRQTVQNRTCRNRRSGMYGMRLAAENGSRDSR